MNTLIVVLLLQTFTQKPEVRDRKIEFTASAATDCAVSILDAQGRTVRHLVAGVLGPNAPEPLRKNSLAQSLVWDGKDDLGRPATGGPFKVHVGLGLKPAFERFIGHNPAALGSVRGLACGPGGELYVLHVFGTLHPNDGTLSVSVFDRQGKYLRTILPFPAGLPDDKLAGLKRIDKLPFIYQAETRSLLPGAGDLPSQRPVVTKSGRLAFVGIQEVERYARPGIAQVVAIEKDGAMPPGGPLRTKLAALSGTAASLALSPDEQTLYATGLGEGSALDGTPSNAVYAFGWNDPAPRVLVKGPLNLPRCVATGKDGTLYVADRGNNRIAAFHPDGKPAGEIAVERPERLEVHPATGAIYVLGGANCNVIQKFDSLKAEKPAATITIPFFKHERFTAVLALDASAEPPVLWAASYQGSYAKYALLRIEDRGTFAAPVDVGKDAGPSVGAVTEISVDESRGRLFANGQVFDARTGERIALELPKLGGSGPTNTLGRDGNYYAYHNYPNAMVSRYGPDLKPLPFEKSPKLEELGSPRLRGRGVAADAAGNVFVLWQKPDKEQTNALALFGPDGGLKNKTLIDADIRSLNSVRVDAAGNIYLALGLRPGKDRLPPALLGKLPDGKTDPDAVRGVNFYPLLYGSIAKFGPDGGEIRPGAGGIPCNYAWGTETEVKGARWIVPGASNVPSWRTKGTPDICLCESSRFDVDGFGRSFFPDAGLFRMGILDTNGNSIGWVGTYGNPDSGGADVPLWWPHAVTVGDKAAFIADRLNRRVVRLELGYRAEGTVAIP
jgi:hypothetical protein